MTKTQLNPEEREFFARICKAAFANPFSDERDEVDLEISGLPPAAPKTERINIVVQKVSDRIRFLEKDRRANVNLYSGKDREFVEKVFLFELFGGGGLFT